MKYYPLVFILLLGCASCGEKGSHSSPAATDETIPPGAPQAKAVENVSVNSNQPTTPEFKPWYYETNGNASLKIFANTNDGQIVSAKAVDEAGAVKWSDHYSYDANSQRLTEMRRTKSDGTIIQVFYQYSSDGKQTKVMIGPDGKVVPAEEQETILNQ